MLGQVQRRVQVALHAEVLTRCMLSRVSPVRGMSLASAAAFTLRPVARADSPHIWLASISASLSPLTPSQFAAVHSASTTQQQTWTAASGYWRIKNTVVSKLTGRIL